MARNHRDISLLGDDPLWYKDAIIYELHVRAFFDSNEDGIGDFNGLSQKLDYLQGLGITAIWLLPFFPSPLKDDGYDIADYSNVHSNYGTIADFKRFVKEAHRKGLRVITEMPLNHTSDQHPWFQRARRAPQGSPERDYYVWSDTPDRYKGTRIIFKDFEHSNWSWDPVAKAYYWHRFYAHQPDLNFDNPEVQKAVFQFIDFWLNIGVDGLRLDAIPYLFEREGTSCENLPETHEFLKRVRSHVERRYRNRMLLAEANQWPEDAVPYFGDGHECQMAFHFPIMPRLYMSVRMEDSFPIIDILEQTPAIPEKCQWALFLRNHDELTLEMVTDEERDYMYRSYAEDPQMRLNLGIRRRLAPLLGNQRKKIELLHCLLFSLPGTPVLYYGDEIGMGDNVYLGDRNGVRSPMQWSSDRNAGFSRANPNRLYLPVNIDPAYHYEALNVEVQENSPSSLLRWMKRFIGLRRRYRAFGRGSIQFLSPKNRRVLAFIREHEEEKILVVANLSRFVQYVELDLSTMAGHVPKELFGQNSFPPIGELPYLLTLGPHGFLWFSLEEPKADHTSAGAEHQRSLPEIVVTGGWQTLFQERDPSAIESCLLEFVRGQRWFGGKARKVRAAHLHDIVPIPTVRPFAFICLLEVSYFDADSEIYTFTITHCQGQRAATIEHESSQFCMARIKHTDSPETGLLYEALAEPSFCNEILAQMIRQRPLRGRRGQITFERPTWLQDRIEKSDTPVPPNLLKGEQSNSSVAFGDRFMLKVFRKPDLGVNPELELTRHLTQTGFKHMPTLAGAIEYRGPQRSTRTLGVLSEFVPNQGDAWKHTQIILHDLIRSVVENPDWLLEISESDRHVVDAAQANIPDAIHLMLGGFGDLIHLLGTRTAAMHSALATGSYDSELAPENFTPFYQRSLFQSLRNQANSTVHLLRHQRDQMSEADRDIADAILAKEEMIFRQLRAVADGRLSSQRIRIHGDYHLGQVLFTGSDFVIMDFEGPPMRSIGERKIKRTPLRDVAGMLRSFDYAVHFAARTYISSQKDTPVNTEVISRIARLWPYWVSARFLRSYFEEIRNSQLLSEDRAERMLLLDTFVLEKALYEIGYELNNRPDWVGIPLHAVQRIITQPGHVEPERSSHDGNHDRKE